MYVILSLNIISEETRGEALSGMGDILEDTGSRGYCWSWAAGYIRIEVRDLFVSYICVGVGLIALR